MSIDAGAGLQQQTLGDLDHDGITGQAKRLQVVKPGLIRSSIVVKLSRRFIDADLKIRTHRAAPAQRLLGHFAKRPITDVNDQAAGFGNWDEISRAYQPAHGVLPAHQSLGLVNDPGHQVNDGLVDHQELLIGKARAQIVSKARSLQSGFFERRGEKAEAIAPRTFGHVQCLVGVFKQAFCLVGVCGEVGNTYTGRYKNLVITQLKGHRHCPQNAFDDALGAGVIAQVGQQYRELVTAHACHCVAIAQALADPSPSFNEELVALGVAQRVIDFLEVIQVDEEHRHALLADCACLHFSLQPLAQHASIRQARQRIEVGLVPDQRVDLLALADIGVGAQHAQRFAVGAAADHRAARKNPFPATVPAAHPVFIDVVGGLSVKVRLLVAQHQCFIFRVYQVRIVVAALPDFVFAVSVHLLVPG